RLRWSNKWCDVRFWPLADMSLAVINVRFWGGKAVVLRRGRRCRDGWKPPHIHICSVGRRELGVWDLSHSLSGTSLVGLSITEIPLNYGIFCSTYDFVVACYLIISATAWHEPGRFRPLLLATSPSGGMFSPRNFLRPRRTRSILATCGTARQAGDCIAIFRLLPALRYW